ncbi:MAG TPA: CheR family methyltransferase [Steroidobacteraceae bacterium]|nr:CheR family methyltransferase [Steroidobacteraceae bacterium]
MAKTRQKSDTKKRTAVKPLQERREASQAVSGATDEPARKRDGMFPIVGIGASAGGIEAFKALLGALRDDAGMAYVFVLHLAPSHVSMLAQILARETRMPVTEVQDEPEVMPDRVYVIPPGRAMIIRDGCLHLIPETELPRHPIDTFFRSLAQDRGHLAIGVVLSGSATDGTLGMSAIKAVGGITFAQDASAQHDGMPRSAIGSGCVDFILPPREIAAELTRLARHPYVTAAADLLVEPGSVDELLELVRHHCSVDFSQYKANTLHRRIRRRMALHKFASFNEYAAYLTHHAEEIEALCQDILISVTNFFRNAEAFEALKANVLPRLFRDRGRQDPVRVWVLGCSTGEEAYSLAIVLAEYVSEMRHVGPVALYATDLNNSSIDRARVGVYPRSIAEDVSPDRLQRFFVEVDGGYRVTKSIRDMCIFARQNALTDPPFSHMDLVSCRNVMIYMESALQRKLLFTLHYALKPHGYLFLGPSETIGSSRELFDVDDVKHKIYSKKPAKLRPEQAFPVAPYTPRSSERRAERWAEQPRDVTNDIQREADRVLLTRYVPAGVLVNEEGEVVQFRGDTGLYLAPAPGKASLNVLKMAREGLLVSLRALLQKSKEDAVVHEADVRVKSNGGYRSVAVSVIPVRHGHSKERWFWVLFEDAKRAQEHIEAAARGPRSGQRGRKAQAASVQDQDEQVERLTQELAATREYLQSLIEQQEAANEELQSANEEVQSANEELQSINEELETSKEEIQSSNEELRTVNEELHNRNEELGHLNDDLNNLLSSVEIAIVMVWRDLRIRRFTPLAERHFNLIATDVGRPIGDIKLNLDVPDLPQLLSEAIGAASINEMEVQDGQGRWYLLSIRPYRTLQNKVDGAVIVLIDIQALKANQEVLERQSKLLEQTHEAIFVRDLGGEIVYWNRGAELLYGYAKEEAIGRKDKDLLGRDPARNEELDRALADHGKWRGELEHRTKEGRVIAVESIQIVVREGGRTRVLETNHDINERKRLEQTLQQRVAELALADQRKNEFLALLAHELRNPLAPLRNAVHILKRSGQEDGEIEAGARGLIERQVATMTRLVDDLLDAARINRGQVQLQLRSTELQSILRQAVQSTQHVMEERRQHLSVQLPATPVLLEADPTRLEQIFANLLTNAAKYTPEAGEIKLTAEVLAGSDGSPHPSAQAVVRISDSGIGIEPEMLPRVFELFAQGDRSLGRSRGGLGIGLTIVRSLVELHGGTVTAHSEGHGRGSEFIVRLPLSPGTWKSGEPKPRTSPGSRAAVDHGERKPSMESLGANGESANGESASRKDANGEAATRVLVVDDNPDIAESTSLVLKLAGYEVKTALSGQDAIDVAASFQPEIVLLDIGMPGLDGYAVARRLRGEPKLKNALLIAVSGYGTAADHARTKQAGFDRHLVKPVEPVALQQLLGDLTARPH